MNKKHTVNAQDVKAALERAAAKIGSRKRMRAGAFFEMLLDCLQK
jgi:hypothetical protein